MSAALAVTGFASLTGGAVVGATGLSHIYDAVNIYNDGLSPLGGQSLNQGGEAPSNKPLQRTDAFGARR
jgi:hypothetical protein